MKRRGNCRKLQFCFWIKTLLRYIRHKIRFEVLSWRIERQWCELTTGISKKLTEKDDSPDCHLEVHLMKIRISLYAPLPSLHGWITYTYFNSGRFLCRHGLNWLHYDWFIFINFQNSISPGLLVWFPNVWKYFISSLPVNFESLNDNIMCLWKCIHTCKYFLAYLIAKSCKFLLSGTNSGNFNNLYSCCFNGISMENKLHF